MKYISLLLPLVFSAFALSAQERHLTPVALPKMPATLNFAGEEVPLENFDTRESLEKELMVTCYMHSRTTQTLLNTKRYFSIIEPILQSNGIPRDFVYLCLAESGLNPGAVSASKAGGLWQIMPATGKSYGLEVGADVDERFHIEKSTQVACKYIKEAYDRFGSWTLAAASYNLGQSGVATRIKKQGTTSYYDSFFPEETMRYLFRILAFKMVCENPVQYGLHFASEDYHKPYTDYKEIEISGTELDWSEIARKNGTTYKMLRELNNWIRTYDHPNKANKKYKLKIPEGDFRK